MFEYLDLLNNNRILWGVTMIMLNIGSRFVIADLGKFHESLLTNEYVKKLILFCMFFVATRDILVAFVLTILYIIVVDGMLHEKRKFCIIPKRYIDELTKKSAEQVNEHQYLEAKKVVMAYELASRDEEAVGGDTSNYSKYITNVALLNKTI